MHNKLFLAVAAFLMSTSLHAQDLTFEAMDVDGDGKVTKEEFHSNIIGWGKYSDFDKDGDGYLTSSEYSITHFDAGLYDDWDANKDGQLDEYEYYDGAFGYYDKNEDGHWQSDEWGDAGDDGFWDM